MEHMSLQQPQPGLEPVSSLESNDCRVCGQKFTGDECPNCGAVKGAGPLLTEAQKATQEAHEQERANPKEFLRCSTCGKLMPKLSFGASPDECTNCGTVSAGFELSPATPELLAEWMKQKEEHRFS